MMVGIISVFYSENCGSLLQAFALFYELQRLGFNPVFINTKSKHSSHSLKSVTLRFGKRVLTGQFKYAINAIQNFRSFSKYIDLYFPCIEYNDAINNREFETFILGSDTVWDMERIDFSSQTNIFWPRNTGKRVISYAPSVANTTLEKIKNMKFPEETLKSMNAISVRDQHSYDVISALTDKKISMVCDPTLLVEKKCFDCFKYDIKEYKYIVLYLFEDLDEKQIQEIIDYAKYSNCKIISVGKNYKWCDKVVAPTLDNFISYISSSNYVITNTFHGSIFSIIYHKQFVSFGITKKKVTEVLSSLGLENNLYKNEKSVYDILNEKIDYEVVEEKLKKMRIDSLTYLKNNLLVTDKLQDERRD